VDDADWERLGVSPAHREAAEEVRDHLVCLRGGAPFLSPRDALALVRWLDDGVPVPVLLIALERAAARRRATRARTPLTLVALRPHLPAVRAPDPVPETWSDQLRDARRGAKRAWEQLDEEGRDALYEAARARLGDLLLHVDEATSLALVEEEARDLFRTARPDLGGARALVASVAP
jgi:hypothetical protein